MLRFRFLATGVTALAVAAASIAPATGASATGVGTAATTTSVVDVAVGTAGSVLKLGLLADDSRSTIDPSVASPEAFVRLLRTSLSTPVAAVNDLTAALPAVEARQPNGQPTTEVPGATVALPPTAVGPVPAGAVAGITVDPVKLSAAAAASGSTAGLAAGVSDASVVGGLIRATGASVSLGTDAGTAASTADRGVKVGEVTVLDLGALLAGLGVDLADLPVTSLSALLDTLGLTATVESTTGIDIDGTLAATVDDLNTAIDDLQALVTSGGGTVDSTLDTLLGTVGLDAPTTVDTTQANALLDDVQSTLADLLEGGLTVLDDAPLLQLGGVEVGMASKAAGTVAESAASVTGKVGAIKVGSIELLGGTDLLAATDRVASVVASVNTLLSGVLGTVHPDLAALVNVSVLDKETSVTQVGEYVRSVAGITAATATITPPATLTQVLSALANPVEDTVGEVIVAAGGVVPEVGVLMTGLQDALTLATGVLSSPATVKIASVGSASEFRVVAAPATPPGGELPRTGGTSLLLFGGVAAVLALISFRLARTPGLRPTKR